VGTLPILGLGAPLAAYLKFRPAFFPLLGLGAILLVFLGLGVILVMKNPASTKAYVASLTGITILFSFLLVVPKADPCKSVKALCQKAVELSQRERAPIVLCGIGNSHAGEFNFYTKRVPLPLMGKGDRSIKRALEREEKILMITKGRYFRRYQRKYHFKILAQQPCGHRFTLFSNKDFMLKGGTKP